VPKLRIIFLGGGGDFFFAFGNEFTSILFPIIPVTSEPPLVGWRPGQLTGPAVGINYVWQMSGDGSYRNFLSSVNVVIAC